MHHLAKSVTAICMAETTLELHKGLQQGIEGLGFQSYNLSFRKKDRQEFMSAPTLTSWSSQDLARYSDDGWVEKDPLLEMASQPMAPLAWIPAQWAGTSEHGAYGEFIASTGITSGATAALDHRVGSLSAITALSFSAAPRRTDDAYALLILGQISVTRAAVLGIPEADIANFSHLSRLSSRQMEILQWAAQGKSNSDISIIVGLSKRTVDYHISEILKKLEVATKAQAAAIYSSR